MLTKEQLTQAGVPDTLIPSLLQMGEAADKALIDGNYIPRATYDAEVSRRKTAEQTVTERDTQIVELGKKAEGVPQLQQQIAELSAKNVEAMQAAEVERVKASKKILLSQALQKDGCVDAAEVADKINLDILVLDEATGTLSGYEAQRDAIKAAKPYFFADAPTAGAAGQQGGTQPAAKGALPGGFVPVGTTPPAGSDPTQPVSPEERDKQLAQSLFANRGVGADDQAKKATNHYFGKNDNT